MLVAFRTDANSEIGTGHVMRCLALAEALGPGSERVFLCREEGLGRLADRIRSGGHKLLLLKDGSPEECRRQLEECGPIDWLVADHYGLDRGWETAMRSAARYLMVIDDLADRLHDCDLLLDANYRPGKEARYAGLVPPACALLLGPRYALLRPEFAAARPAAQSAPLAGENIRILVMFGGADADDLTGRAIDAIARLHLDAHVDIVTGPLYRFAANLQRRLASLPSASLHPAPDNVADLMAAADFAVGSPGTTSWERCALGLPTIAIAVADNQEAMAESLARSGAHLYLGRDERLDDADLLAAVRLMAGNPAMREAMRRQALTLADGRGARRVARRLAGPAIGLRRAEPADSELLYAWRNDPRVRRHAFDASPIARDSHEAWFRRTLADPLRILLIGRIDGADFGCLRFDLDAERARISIYLDPERLGEGLAVPLLVAADTWLAADRPGVAIVAAEVMAGNEASRHAFLGAGYRLDHNVFVKTCGAANSAGGGTPGREKGPS